MSHGHSPDSEMHRGMPRPGRPAARRDRAVSEGRSDGGALAGRLLEDPVQEGAAGTLAVPRAPRRPVMFVFVMCHDTFITHKSSSSTGADKIELKFGRRY